MDNYYNNVFKRGHEAISGSTNRDKEVEQKLRRLAEDLVHERQSTGQIGSDMQFRGMPKPVLPTLNDPLAEYQRMVSAMNGGLADSGQGNMPALQIPSMVEMQKTFMMMMQQQQLQQQQVHQQHALHQQHQLHQQQQQQHAPMTSGPTQFNRSGAQNRGKELHEHDLVIADDADSVDAGDRLRRTSANANQQQNSAGQSSSSSDRHTRNGWDDRLLDAQRKIFKQQEVFFERVVELIAMTTTLVQGVVLKYGVNPADLSDAQRGFPTMPSGMAAVLAKRFNGQNAQNPLRPGVIGSGGMHSLGAPSNMPPMNASLNPYVTSSHPNAMKPLVCNTSSFSGLPYPRSFTPSPNDVCVSRPVQCTVVGSAVTPAVSKSTINVDNTVTAVSVSPNASSSASVGSVGHDNLVVSETPSAETSRPPTLISPSCIKQE